MGRPSNPKLWPLPGVFAWMATIVTRWLGRLMMVGGLVSAAGAAESGSAEKPALVLTIEMPNRVLKSSEPSPFVVTFFNTHVHKLPAPNETIGEASARAAENLVQNLEINGGNMLGNRAEIWSNLKMELRTAGGEPVPVILGWQVPGVAGRVYPLVVPLRAGSRYSVQVNADDYFYKGGTRQLTPGKYEVRFIFQGKPWADGSVLPPAWTGEVISNTLTFEVLPD